MIRESYMASLPGWIYPPSDQVGLAPCEVGYVVSSRGVRVVRVSSRGVRVVRVSSRGVRVAVGV